VGVEAVIGDKGITHVVYLNSDGEISTKRDSREDSTHVLED